MRSRGMPAGRELARNWDAVLGRLQLVVPERQFRTWLKDTRAVEVAGESLVVQVKSQFHADWLQEHLEDEIADAVAGQFGGGLRLRWESGASVPSAPALVGAGEPGRTVVPGGDVFGRLTPGCTFGRYQVAAGNRMAFEAATALAEGDTWRPTPLVVHGTPGVGKTHLLQAVAWRARERDLRVACLSWQDFVGRFVASLRPGNDPDSFKERVRNADLLIIDDLRDVTTAPKSVDELTAAIDGVRSSNGAVLVSAELPPKALGLPERLTSRLEEGLVVQVDAFNAAERRQYSRRHASEAGVELPEWAVERLAAFPAPSVRVLAGAVNAAVALCRTGRLEAGGLDAALAALVLEQAPTAHGRDLGELIGRVAAQFAVGTGDLLGRERTATIRDARAVAAAALRRQGLSVAEVGARLGDRKKGTVPGLVTRGEELLAADPGLSTRLAV